MDDAAAVAAQLGRPLRSAADVAVRCPLGLPVVTRVAPLLDDGTPFPTRYWLSCPLAVRRIGRIESAGGVRAMDRRAERLAGFQVRLDAAHARYAAERDALVPPGTSPRPSGGVGGAETGVKCLHAHYADHAVGNDNPVGELVAPWVEPLDCTVACVVDGDPNPRWREPK
ncbi:MAG TPA: DUF501 domain-containing protein [Acidimicrobiia bacterium]|nr:DUF501 domain-containing protein [Acidimicrobiia bacterium]